jgi:NitT/TauT family transport system substrate-binding protein
MSRNRIIAVMTVGLVVITAGLTIWATYGTTPKCPGSPAKIRLGVGPGEHSTLIWIAENRGYFAENNLDVTITVYEGGALAIKDFFAARLDIVTTGDFVFVVNSFQRPNIRIFGVIDEFNSNRVVARKDSGINLLSDLKGKRVGILKGSQAEFCLARLLVLNDISSQEISVVDLSPTQQISAIENGTIDAALVWEPYVQKIRETLGINAVSLPGQSDQNLFWLLICTDDMIRTQPMVLRSFLASLIKAGKFLNSDQTEAKVIAAKRFGSDIPYLESVWKNNKFDVSLPQGLILTLEDQARWLQSSGTINMNEIPDFLDFVYFQGLETLKPEAVTMIH